jgi:hypothetical protein
MSQAYRIKLRESETRVLHAEDKVCTRLELLEVLPADQMTTLLKQALQQRGYAEQPDGTLQRQHGKGLITVDPCEGTVSVSIQEEQEVVHTAEKNVSIYPDISPRTLRKEERQLLREEIDKQFANTQQQLQKNVADQLEQILQEVRGELDAVVNQVLREAIKIKARQMGEIREVHEDVSTGELTIKLEV